MRRAERARRRRQGRLGAAGRDAAGRADARPARDPRRDRRPACCAARPSSASAKRGDGILILSPDDARRAPTSPRARRPARRGPRGQRHARTAPTRCRTPGIAREVAALFETQLAAAARPTSVAQIALPAGRGRRRRDPRPGGCPRYTARIITGLQVGAEPAGDARPAGRLRRARDLQPGRRHQLRDARDRPPAARVRPRPARAAAIVRSGARTAASR